MMLVLLTRTTLTVKDNDHEAVPGDVLTQILARVPNSIGYKVSNDTTG